MASTRWSSLSPELRLMILEFLVQDGTAQLSPFVTVCREWQTTLERHNFARIRLTPSRLDDFGPMLRRNHHLVRYIWFCLELDPYDCSRCAPVRTDCMDEDDWVDKFKVGDTEYCPITKAFRKLFSTLSRWDDPNEKSNNNNSLVLDISIYSLSDSEHWFKYLTFLPDHHPSPSQLTQAGSARKRHDDARHGWVAGFRQAAPPRQAISKLFHGILEDDTFDSEELELQWWDQLEPVPAVTSVLLRQQNRRRWNPRSLAHMLARFPRLQDLYYEPWREWDSLQRLTDKAYQYLLRSLQQRNKNLKRLVLFENFNQQYPVTMQRFLFGEDLARCDSIRKPNPAISRAVALASLPLEHLAASYLADAGQFFDNIEPVWEWPHLKTLVVTSILLKPDGDRAKIGAMLRRAAGTAAARMPRLEVMEIWNGRKGLAALFRYQVVREKRQATISWKATWGGKFEVMMEEESLRQAWEAVMQSGHTVDDSWSFKVIVHNDHDQNAKDTTTIKSHADAIDFLDLLGPGREKIIRPVSLHQIRIEQEALGGLRTLEE